MSKYYTPKIEEFHVGFEYEYLNHFGKDFGKWTTETVNNRESFFQLSNLLISSIRVKYLDQEDIESFGFKQGKLSYQYFDGIHILISLENHNISITHIADEQGLFYGKIKNKSELKKVLEMIGVLKDE